jgi:hypothetical protein
MAIRPTGASRLSGLPGGLLGGALALGLALASTPASAIQISNTGTPTLNTDGECTAGNQTRFNINWTASANKFDVAAGALDYFDYFVVYMLDVDDTVLGATGHSIWPALGAFSSSSNPFTEVTPAGGPLKFLFHDDDNGSFNFAVGDTFDPAGLAIVAEVTFDANALDPDCPAAVVAQAGGGATASQSQQQSGSNAMFNQAGQNTGQGIQNAVAEQLFGGDGTQGSFGNTNGTAYVSLRGMRMAARDRLKRRIQIANGTYVAPRAGSGARVDRDVHSISGQAISGQAINGQSAIAAAFPDAPPVSDGTVGADDGSAALLGYDDLSPALLGDMEASRWNVWMRGTFTHFDGDAFSGDTWHGIGGVDYRYTSNILIGALAGYEGGDFEFSSTNGAFDGTGFTTGAYVGVKLSETLVMDAFLTHTWLDYDNRAGTATGETDATRIMVSVNMSGRYGITDSLTLEPNIRLFYAHESQDAYTLSNGTAIAANGIDSGRLSLGPKVRYALPDTSNGNWSVFVSAHGEYDFSSEVQTSTALPDFDDLVTARLGAGIDGTLLNGWMIQLAGDVGGLGSGSFTSYTGTGRVRIPLN